MLLRSWAGLENLLVPEGRKIKELAARRISRLLASTKDEREKLSAQIKTSYRVRSEVAHGSTADSDILPEAWQAFELLQSTLRTLIIRSPDITLAEIDRLP
jgi:hypothetical protein